MSQLSDKALCSVVYRLVGGTFLICVATGGKYMYEEPYLHIILLSDNDIVRMSDVGSDDWSDENVDDDGWI